MNDPAKLQGTHWWHRSPTVIAVVILASFALAAVFLPNDCCNSSMAIRAQCLSNVRNQTRLILMYSDDHDDRLPPDVRWMASLSPYMRNLEILRCPRCRSEGSDTE